MSRPRRLTGCFEALSTFESLHRAAHKAARGHRHSRSTCRFLAELEPRCLDLSRALRDGRWQPARPRTFRIRDPKPRTIAVSPFEDRVVHHALCTVLAPLFERSADPDSYACRTGKGQHRAIQRVQQLARRHPWVGRLDVHHCFETISHAVLLRQLQRRIACARTLQLCADILAAGGAHDGRGLPIGSLTSQHFGNFLLGHLDHHARRHLRPAGWVRYMDDIVLFGPDRAATWSVVDGAIDHLVARLRLRPKDALTAVFPVQAGIPFLGFRIWPHQRRLDAARARRARKRLKQLRRAPDTPRSLAEAEAVLAWLAVGHTRAFRQHALDTGRPLP